MAKKEIDMCDWCDEQEAAIKITDGDDAGDVLCEDCFEEWKEAIIEDMYEDLD